MQRCMELERTGPGILDAQLQFKPGAAYQYSQLAGERVGPKSARLVGVFDTKRRASVTLANVVADDTPIASADQAVVGQGTVRRELREHDRHSAPDRRTSVEYALPTQEE